MIARIRPVCDIPIVLFGYYNPVFIFGCEAFARSAEAAGVDGSAMVKMIAQNAGRPDLIPQVCSFAGKIKRALSNGGGT